MPRRAERTRPSPFHPVALPRIWAVCLTNQPNTPRRMCASSQNHQARTNRFNTKSEIEIETLVKTHWTTRIAIVNRNVTSTFASPSSPCSIVQTVWASEYATAKQSWSPIWIDQARFDRTASTLRTATPMLS